MPFTPFHFGPCAAIGLPLSRRIDLPMFLLANVAVDIEPLAVMLGGITTYPLHGYCHTLLFGAIIGLALALACYPLRGVFGLFLAVARIPYAPTCPRMALWAVLGAWFHVLLDSMIYHDIRPLWPSEANPLLGLVGTDLMYDACAAASLPALAFWLVLISRGRKK